MEGNSIVKSDEESAMLVVRDAAMRYHGEKVIPETPAKGEKRKTARRKMQGTLSGKTHACSYDKKKKQYRRSYRRKHRFASG